MSLVSRMKSAEDFITKHWKKIGLAVTTFVLATQLNAETVKGSFFENLFNTPLDSAKVELYNQNHNYSTKTDKNGNFSIETEHVAVDDNNIAEKFKLYQNYPNPFNGSTNIVFENDKYSKINLKIFDIQGELKGKYSDYFSAGQHTINTEFNLPSGVYFIYLNNGKENLIKKVALLDGNTGNNNVKFSTNYSSINPNILKNIGISKTFDNNFNLRVTSKDGLIEQIFPVDVFGEENDLGEIFVTYPHQFKEIKTVSIMRGEDHNYIKGSSLNVGIKLHFENPEIQKIFGDTTYFTNYDISNLLLPADISIADSIEMFGSEELKTFMMDLKFPIKKLFEKENYVEEVILSPFVDSVYFADEKCRNFIEKFALYSTAYRNDGWLYSSWKNSEGEIIDMKLFEKAYMNNAGTFEMFPVLDRIVKIRNQWLDYCAGEGEESNSHLIWEPDSLKANVFFHDDGDAKTHVTLNYKNPLIFDRMDVYFGFGNITDTTTYFEWGPNSGEKIIQHEFARAMGNIGSGLEKGTSDNDLGDNMYKHAYSPVNISEKYIQYLLLNGEGNLSKYASINKNLINPLKNPAIVGSQANNPLGKNILAIDKNVSIKINNNFVKKNYINNKNKYIKN